MKKTLAISLSPNVFINDFFSAIIIIFQPWKYNTEGYVKQLEKWFKDFFDASFAFSYISGRGGLYEILKAYNIGKGDEVLLQAFTCVALPNAILAVEAKPIYVDISSNLTINPVDLEKKITTKTKAIIMQHSFGVPSDIEKICAIAKRKKIPVIEDCAHGIGISYNGKKLGQFGDATFFSFGRDKAFSSIFGGMVITNDKILAKNLEVSYKGKMFPSIFWTAQQLFHPIAFMLILSVYDFFSLGKLLLVFFQKLHLLSFPVTNLEKKGIYNKSEVLKLPGALAYLALEQLQRIKEFNEKRQQYGDMYLNGLKQYAQEFSSTTSLPYLRFPMLSEKRDILIGELRKQHIYLGKWYANVIDPVGTDFNHIEYKPGSCPKAEWVAKRIFNLPTMPTMTVTDVQRVITAVRQYV